MRRLIALLAALLLGLGAFGCGKTGKDTSSPQTPSSSPGSDVATSSSSLPQSPSSLKGDEDDDDEPSETAERRENDPDDDFDNEANQHTGYYDKDDGSIRNFGAPASASVARTLTTLATLYYAAAARGDGSSACSMITATYIRAIPEDYGQAPGPLYLRGKSCSRVMSLLFEHERERLSEPRTVTDVRIRGNQARIILGSRTQPAVYLTVERERSSWKVAGLLAQPLP